VRSEGTRAEVTRVQVGGDVALVGRGTFGCGTGGAGMSVQMVDAARLRALVGFGRSDRASLTRLQDFSAGLAQCAIVIMYPGSDPSSATRTSRPVASRGTLITL